MLIKVDCIVFPSRFTDNTRLGSHFGHSLARLRKCLLAPNHNAGKSGKMLIDIIGILFCPIVQFLQLTNVDWLNWPVT